MLVVILIDSIKKNFLYNSVYQILVMIIPLITTPYVSRVLGSLGVGKYSYSYSVASYFALFAMLGVNNYGNRSIAMVRDDQEKCSGVFWSVYYFQLFCSALVILVYCVYVLLICEDKLMGWIMLLCVFSASLDINWLYIGLEKFKTIVLRNIFIKTITVISIFLFVKTRLDLYIYSAIYAFGAFLSQIILWLNLKKYISKTRVTLIDIMQHIKPNLVLFVPVIAISLYTIMDKIMLGIITTKEEVGYYESCEKLLQLPLGLINSLGIVMLPRISNLLANNKPEQSEKYLGKSIVFAMFLATSLSFGIMAVSREFVPIFFGVGFERCIVIIQSLMPSCIFLAFANVIRTQYLIPNQEDQLYVVSVIFGAATNLIVNMIYIPIYGAVGAAIGTLCAQAVVCIIQCFGVRKKLNFRQYILNSCPMIISSIFMYVFLYYVLPVKSGIAGLVIKVLVGTVFYFVGIIPFAIVKMKNKNYFVR